MDVTSLETVYYSGRPVALRQQKAVPVGGLMGGAVALLVEG